MVKSKKLKDAIILRDLLYKAHGQSLLVDHKTSNDIYQVWFKIAELVLRMELAEKSQVKK